MALTVVNCIFGIISIIATIIYSGRSSLFTQKLNELLHWKSGCNPISSVGKAEAIRMLMVDQQIPFTETNYTEQTWPNAKHNGTATGLFTFGQVPAITTSKGLQFVDSKVIIQVLGRSVGLDCDCADITKCDTIAAGVNDLYMSRSKVWNDPNSSYSTRNKFINDILFTWLGYFERLVPNSTSESDGIYFSSERLTWVDYLVFELIESNCGFISQTAVKQNNPDSVNKQDVVLNNYIKEDNEKYENIKDCQSLIENFPKLNTFYKSFRNRSRLKTYLNGKRHSLFIPLPKIK
ncbi:uncharacterized protein LOC100207134 isoform X2 [Hydra vulgaris]|uniref:uncharacterized protein LOC100207134 isoform X2 n=1 Tax=Hydra vulgaris TaxID=6087 RepID=UPI001F5FC47E|nr:uncharacterized protein LOC100207134 isoform X2 [Hydra vulgaris]